MRLAPRGARGRLSRPNSLPANSSNPVSSSTPPTSPETQNAPRGVCISGGEGGIRTHGTASRTPDFKSGALDHSATSPKIVIPAKAGTQRLCTSTSAAGIRIPLPGVGNDHFILLRPRGRASRYAIWPAPPMYGRSASGTVIEPSRFWKFSITAIRQRPTARPEPLSVCTSSGLPVAGLRQRACIRRA